MGYLLEREGKVQRVLLLLYGTFSRILFSQTNNCAPRTISFLLFHSFFIVHRSVLTAGNLIKLKPNKVLKISLVNHSSNISFNLMICIKGYFKQAQLLLF